jgi:hypothetical protein
MLLQPSRRTPNAIISNNSTFLQNKSNHQSINHAFLLFSGIRLHIPTTALDGNDTSSVWSPMPLKFYSLKSKTFAIDYYRI